MIKKSILAVIIAGLLLLVFQNYAELYSLADEGSSKVQSVVKNSPQDELIHKQGIYVYTFESGQTLLVKEIKDTPLVSIITWVDTGSINEDDKNNGVSHFLEHLLFKGTTNHKVGEIDKILESVGADSNAGTSKDFTNYIINVPAEKFPIAMELHADMLINANFPAEELEKERKVVIEEIRRSEDSPERLLMDNLFKAFFIKHPYRRNTLGPRQNIENLSRDEIFKYYKTWYKPVNFTTVVVGNIQKEEVIKSFSKGFNPGTLMEDTLSTSEKNMHPKKYPLHINKVADSKLVEKQDIKNAYLMIGWKTTTDVADMDTYALDLLSTILGNGESSRLYKHLYQNNKVVTNVESWLQAYKDISLFGVDATLNPENMITVREAIFNLIEDIAANGITDSELNKAKAIAERSFIYNNESASNIANIVGYNMIIANLDEYLGYLKKLNTVTKEDIQRVTKKYLVRNKAVLSEVVPQNYDEKSYKIVNLPLLKESDVKHTVQKKVLPNGLTLISKENDGNDVISISFLIKGGKLSEEKPGLVNLFTTMLTKGTEARTALDIAEETERFGIVLESNMENNAVRLNVKSTKKDVDRALMIASDLLRNSNFPEDIILKEKETLLENIKNSRNKPSSVAMEQTQLNFYPAKHPYTFVGSIIEKNLHEITRENLLDYYHKFVNPNNMIVTVVGNLDPFITANSIGQIWNSKDQGEKYQIPLTEYQKRTEDHEVIVEKESSAAWLVLGINAPTIDNIKDYSALKIIDTILSGGFSSRLYKKFREEKPLAYQVGTSASPALDMGSLLFYIGTDPQNLKEVKQKFLEEIRKLQEEPVTSEELEYAKNNYLGTFKMAHETNTSQGYYLSLYENFGLGYEYDGRIPDIMSEVTSLDIQRVAKKYFSLPKLTVIVGPKSAIEDYKKHK